MDLAWTEMMEREKQLYQGYPIHSCSVEGNAGAEKFETLVSRWHLGKVLDIGCGPQPIPIYLRNVKWAYGLDPIFSHHPFPFVQGIAEALPFRDRAFDSSIMATSLDHCFDPKSALRECHRVTWKLLMLWYSDGQPDEHHPYKMTLAELQEFMKELFNIREEVNNQFFLLEKR